MKPLQLLIAALLPTAALGATIQGLYSTEITGGTSPVGSAPWLRVTISDLLGDPTKVEMKFEAINLTANEYVTEWRFSLNPSKYSSSDNANFSYASELKISGMFDLPSKAMSFNGFNGGVNGMDLNFGFESSNSGGGVKRFTSGDAYRVIVGIAGKDLDATDFLFKSDGQYSVAHVQSIGTANGSGWVAPTGLTTTTLSLPESNTSAAGLALGGFALLGIYRRRRN